MSQTVASNSRVGRLLLQERARRTHTALIAVARAIMVERGRDRFTTRALAAQAAVGIGTVYKHFGDRFEVIETVLQADPIYVAHQAVLDAAAVASRSAAGSRAHREAATALRELIAAIAEQEEGAESVRLCR